MPFGSINYSFGPMAEWLGKGLQNPLQRFNSASDLKSCGCYSNYGILVIRHYYLVYHFMINFNRRKRSWCEEDLRRAAKECKSVRQVLCRLKLRQAGGNYSQINKYLKLYKIDIKHFTGRGWSKGLKGIGKPIYKLEDILVKNSNFQSFKLKKRLFDSKLKPEHCELCGWKKRSNDGRLPLELDHINGDSMDNQLKNLRILCPNCHSLQPTHRGRNMNRKNK